jgi:hypothetical protein
MGLKPNALFKYGALILKCAEVITPSEEKKDNICTVFLGLFP